MSNTKQIESKIKVGTRIYIEDAWEDETGQFHDAEAEVLDITDGKMKLKFAREDVTEWLSGADFMAQDYEDSIIEEPHELTGQGIEPTMRVWVARDGDGALCLHSAKPTWNSNQMFWVWGEKMRDLPVEWFPDLKPGECAEYEITFRKVKG